MRSDWITYKLGDVSDFEGGSQPPKSTFVDTPRAGYIRLLQIRDFKSDKNAVYIPIAKKNRTCKETDIMIGRYGASVGQIHRGKAGAYNVALIKTTPNERIIDKDFFYHYLTSELFQKPLLSVADRSAQAGFSKADIAPFEIPLPSLPEQKRIVAILDEAFAGIDQAIANTEKNLFAVKDIFKSYLNSAFFPHDQDYPDKQSIQLKEICERVSVGHVGITSKYYCDDGIIFLRTQNVTEYGLNLEDIKYITPEFHKSLKKSQVKSGDLLLSRVVTDDMKCAIVPDGIGEANCANVILIRPNANLSSKFLYYLIMSPKTQSYLMDKRVGSAQQVVNTTILKDWKIYIPSLKEQNDLVDKLDKSKTETSRLEIIYEKKIAELNKLKQSLLQKAFSGELTTDKNKLAEAAE